MTPRFLRQACLFVALAAVIFPVAFLPDSRGMLPAASGARAPVAVIIHGGYPELRVEGKPFFIHAATFFYYRVPRDLWERSLEQHRALGINTILLPIPWNWHELRPGEFDFEGRTNPRRDLRGLLKLITEKRFKLIVHVGAAVDPDWRHGGFPDWLFERADAATAAARDWFAAVARELAPYDPRQRHRLPPPPNQPIKKDLPAEIEAAGPLLFVQAGGAVAGDSRLPLSRSPLGFETMRGFLHQAGLDTLVVAADASPDQDLLPAPFASGWFMLPPESRPDAKLARHTLTPRDLTRLLFTADLVKAQAELVPLLTAFQAGWSTPANEAAPPPGLPANMLLSSRLLLGRGLKGITYSPLQDGMTPPAYSVPGLNLHYRWDAALDVNAAPQPRARAVLRNGQLLELWGEFLAASHLRADFGLLIPPTADTAGQKAHAAHQRVLEQIARVALLAGLTCEVVEVQRFSADQLLRYPLLLLPVAEAERVAFPAPVQQKLIAYVRGGGTLLAFPRQPDGEVLAVLWQSGAVAADASGSADPAAVVAGAWSYGHGRAMLSSKDFYSWSDPAESLEASAAAFDAAWAVGALRRLVAAAGIRPAIQRRDTNPQTARLVASQLVSNAGSAPLGRRSAGMALVSVTNLSYDEPVEEVLQILSPHSSARGQDDPWIKLPVSLPPRESLLLPVRFPLCMTASPGEPCTDQIVAAGAELLRAERDGRNLELTFYAPASTKVVLRLAAQPRRIHMEDRQLEAFWEPAAQQFTFALPRGASPEFLRTVRIQLRYEPRVPQKPEEDRSESDDFTFSVLNPLKLPLADDASLLSYPPLLTFQHGEANPLIIEVQNRSRRGRSFKAEVSGPVRGEDDLLLWGEGIGHLRLKLEAGADRVSEAGRSAAADGVLAGELKLSSSREWRTLPLAIVPLDAEGRARYRFDFDRDGADEWVMENAGLRLIASPAAGGRVVAVVDKLTGLSLTTGAGILLDLLGQPDAKVGPPSDEQRLSASGYGAAWEGSGETAAVILRHEAGAQPTGGVTVEKRVRLTSSDRFEAEYRISAPAKLPGASPLVLTTVSSLPVLLRAERTTQFCWPAGLPEAQADSHGSTEEGLHCEAFAPHRPPLRLPQEARRIEIRTPGRLGLNIEWSAGEMWIEMSRTVGLLKLRFPALQPGDSPALHQVRYHVLPTS